MSYGEAAYGEVAYGEGLPAAAGGGRVYSRTLADAASVVDDPRRSVLDFRNIAEFFDLAERTATALFRVRLIPTDAVSVADVVARTVRNYRALLDAGAVADAALRVVEARRQALDALAVQDALVRELLQSGVLYARTLSDEFEVRDSILRTANLYRGMFEAAGIEDAITVSIAIGGAALLSRVIADSIALSDFAGQRVEARRIVSEFLAPAETIARSFLRTRVFEDRVDAADAALRLVLLNRFLLDGVPASDELASQIKYLEQFVGFALMELARGRIILGLDRDGATEMGTAEALPAALSTASSPIEISTGPLVRAKLEVTKK